MTTREGLPATKLNVPLATAVAFSAALCVYAIRQADPDLFGYLAYGRLFLQEGVHASDPFAYTSAGSHWVAFEYLAQIVLWITYNTFGPAGLIALKCVVGGLSIYFLSIAVRTTTPNPIVWVPVFLLATSTVSRFFVFRPQLFTFMFFALYVAMLFKYMLTRSAPLWLLPVVMLFWANSHGGFLAGLASIALVIGLRVAGNLIDLGLRVERALRGTKQLWLVLGACTLVSVLNPQGPRLWQYVLTEVLHDTNRRYIAEWQPAGLNSDLWSSVALTFIAVVLLIAGVTAQTYRRRVAGLPPWLWVSSCLPAIVLACISVRHVPLAALWTAPVITLLASEVWQTARPTMFNVAWTLIGGCSLVPLLLTFNYIVHNPRPAIVTDGTSLGDVHPCTAVSFMRESGLGGNLYLPLWWGSYLTWEMYPEVRVSMDGRNISLFPGEMVEDNLRFYSNEATARDLDAPFRYATDLLLVPAGRAVLVMARADQRWREIFSDAQSSLFVRVDSARAPMASSSPPASERRTTGECAHVLK
jgi:hypothetical protein